MRATFGRVAVVGLLSIGLVGCESARNMFAWGKKKPSDSALAEAPKFGPTLPSNGQTPGSLQNNVPGTNGLTTTTGTLPSASATMPYSTMPAGYQQSAYPTTPYAPAKLSSTPGATTSAGIGTPSTNSYAGSAAGGYGATAATTPAQPQSGFYNPGAYAAASPTTAAAAPAASYTQTPASPYSSAPASSYSSASYASAPSASSYNSTAATSGYGQGYGSSTMPAATSTMPATAATAGQPDYRTADTRNAATAQTNSYLGTSATSAPSATGANGGYGNMTNSYLGTSATTTTNPNSNPASSYNSASAPAAAAPAATTPSTTTPAATAWPPTTTNSLPPAAGATPYQPGATGYQPGNTGYNPPDAHSPPAAGTSTMPATRSDPGYRPGGTSNYTPGGNVLRPGSSTMQSLSRPASGVVPVSYSANATASGATVTQASAAQPEERYGSYQGSENATSVSSSAPTTTHSW